MDYAPKRDQSLEKEDIGAYGRRQEVIKTPAVSFISWFCSFLVGHISVKPHPLNIWELFPFIPLPFKGGGMVGERGFASL